MNRNGTAQTRGRGKRNVPNPSRRRARGKSVERSTAPLQYATTVVPTQPRMGQGQGWTKISHEEIILQVIASTSADTILEVPIIPRLSLPTGEKPIYSGSAPHLRALGAAFAIHRWRALAFEWLPSCPTTTPGNLVLRFYPSYSTQTPVALTDVMDSESLVIVPSLSGKMYRPKIQTRGAPPELRNENATTFSSLASEDKGDYSVGRLVVGTSRQTTSLTLGLVRMKYTVEMRGAVATSGVSA